MDFGYPKYISEDFPGVNATINAALYKDGEPEWLLFPAVLYDGTEKCAACGKKF